MAFSALDNTDNIKVSDKVLDSDGKVFALTAVDTANSTATLSALLIDLSKDSDLSNYYTKTETDNLLNSKAEDSSVMHLSGNETAGGFKTFDRYININGGYIGNEFSNNARSELLLRANRDTVGKSGAYISRFRSNKAQGSMSLSDSQMLGVDFLENEVRTNNILLLQGSEWVNDVPTAIKIVSGVSNNSFGSTSNPCKINNLNPGALSFPNLSSGLDISSYITAGGSHHNEYTPTVDGWISLILKSTSGAGAAFIYQGDLASAQYGNTTLPNENEICVMASLPVKAGIVVNIDIKGSNTYVYSAKFYPNLGNV